MKRECEVSLEFIYCPIRYVRNEYQVLSIIDRLERNIKLTLV